MGKVCSQKGNRALQGIQLVITVALKKEVPKEWFATHDVPVHTLAALKAGALQSYRSSDRGMFIIITGPGPDASEETAYWIRDHIGPLYVLNIGSCGITNRHIPAGQWLRPRQVLNEEGLAHKLDMRLPVPGIEGVTAVESLLSVRQPQTGNIPDHWKQHETLDMECFSQAHIFADTDTSFHCLKFGTDYSDEKTAADFNKNLAILVEQFMNLFSFLESTPSVTAIIPVYNREQTIERALNSILGQTKQPEEIIVVDDASSDRTPDILKRFDDDITIISLRENSGPSAARNAGISEAVTDWIAFLDSDDYWEKNKLNSQLEYLHTYPFYEIFQSEEKWIRNGKRVNLCKHHKKPCGWIWEPSLERCLVSPSGVILKKSLVERHGAFDETLPVCEDYDLWLKISRSHPVGLDPDLNVVKYGGHSDQLSRSYPAMDRFRVRSLLNRLRDEEDRAYREKIIKILELKLKILIKGFKKRGKIQDLSEAEEMLTSLEARP